MQGPCAEFSWLGVEKSAKPLRHVPTTDRQVITSATNPKCLGGHDIRHGISPLAQMMASPFLGDAWENCSFASICDHQESHPIGCVL